MAGLWEWANTPELQAMTLVLGGLAKFRQWHLGATFVPLASCVFYAEIAIALSVVWENFCASIYASEATRAERPGKH